MTTTASRFQDAKVLSEPFKLPCGRVAPNRLVKAPMEEMLASFGGGLPNAKLGRMYQHWARGGWGIVITGNVAVDSTHLGTPFDVTMPPPKQHGDAALQDRFRRYARAVKGSDQAPPVEHAPLAIVQLVHAGRQSMRGLRRAPWRAAMAPSAVSMTTSASAGPLGRVIDFILWSGPQEMSPAQIEELVERFAAAAEVCSRAGFDGVEIHASHGYQIAAFLSPRTNKRTDRYGGSAENRARLLLDIIDAVRKRVPADFAVGVKLNSSDYVQGGLTEEDALLNVKWLAQHGGVDFVEISGGNYENPSFMMDNFDAEAETARLSSQKSPTSVPSSRTKAREAFFQAFAQRARSSVQAVHSDMKLILTGGLRTRKGMADPIASGIVDGVAIGRPACVHPGLPHTILNANVADDDPRSSPPAYVMRGSGTVALLPLRLINAGWGTLWHVAMLSYLSRDEKPNVDASPLEVLMTVFCPTLFSLLRGRIPAVVAFVVVGVTATSSFFLRA